ncbi:MAG: TIGR02300 family protein [SAR202 cluster bacterium]|nr:TIGR02300 family protein [SAR202 cluster bacterium]
MAKPEWGVRRTCLSCGVHYYDMGRLPVSCPKCGVVHDPEGYFRPRRVRAAEAEEAKKVAVVAVANPEAALAVLGDDPDIEIEDDEEAAAVLGDDEDEDDEEVDVKPVAEE